LRRPEMKTKYTYPPFLMMVAAVLVGFVHKVTGFELDLELATGAIAVIGNYLLVQFAADIKKVKEGQPVGSFNSLKLITVLFICGVLGVSNYLQLNYTTEELMMFCGFAMLVITGKSVKDIMGSGTVKEAMRSDDSLTIPTDERI
jgi:arginine exporter protein ArgO